MFLRRASQTPIVPVLAVACLVLCAGSPLFANRQVISLDGTWQIAQGGME